MSSPLFNLFYLLCSSCHHYVSEPVQVCLSPITAVLGVSGIVCGAFLFHLQFLLSVYENSSSRYN